MPLAGVDARVVRVVDVKTPGSGEERRNRYEDLALLRPEEQIKFVICDRADYEWSRAQARESQLLTTRCQVLFSPSAEQLPARRTRRLDPRRPVARAFPDAASQGAVGQCARER